MKNIAVLFGGRSVEHEVSVITGMQIMENMDKSEYNPIPIYITKDGKWLSDESLRDFKTFKEGRAELAREVFFQLGDESHNLYTVAHAEGGLFKKANESLLSLGRVDFVFPALHGTFGEDGSVQGYLDLLQIPYAGANTLSGALGMDKVAMKLAFQGAGLPVLAYDYFFRHDWEREEEAVVAKAEKLGYPLFVKPAHLGSSIGISRATDSLTLRQGIDLALQYDDKVLIEVAAKDPREINQAVLGYLDDMVVSDLEEPIGWEEFLSFEDKYTRGGKGEKGGKTGETTRNIPAAVGPALEEKLAEYSKQAFSAIFGCGTARIDYLLQGEKVYVNEINTMPGSLGFYLWEGRGLPFPQLITNVIKLGERRFAEESKNVHALDFNLFERTSYGSKL